MAWIRWRGRGEAKRAYIGYRDPTTRAEVYPADYRTRDPLTAEAMRVEVERDLERKTPRGPTSTTRVAYEAWLRWLRERGRAEETIRYYRGRLGPWIAEAGGVELGRVRSASIEVYAFRPRTPPWSATTQRGVLQAAGAWLRWCVDRRLPVAPGVADAVEAVDRPSILPNDRAALSPAQIGAIVDAARGTRLEVAVTLAAFAGLPIGDIRTLRWEEVDLEARTMIRRRGRAKARTAYRVALGARVVEALSRVQRVGDLVAPIGRGGHVARTLAAIYDRAGVPREAGDAWHRLRHAFGTGLAAGGADVATVGASLGHQPGSAITLRYIHTDADRIRTAIDALDARSRV